MGAPTVTRSPPGRWPTCLIVIRSQPTYRGGAEEPAKTDHAQALNKVYAKV